MSHINNQAKEMISYTSIANQLASSIDNANANANQSQSSLKPSSLTELSPLPIFLFKVNIKKLSLMNIPVNYSLVISIKFLNYPVLKIPIDSNINHKSTIEINQSVSLFFESNVKELEEKLKKIPLVIVLLDLKSQEILASARIHLTIFAKESFLSYNPSFNSIPNPRRKTILLFHLSDLNKPAGDMDIAILIRREYFKDNNDVNDIAKSYKETSVFISQPDIIMQNSNLDYAWNTQSNKSTVSFDYYKMSNFECDKSSNVIGMDSNRNSLENELGIFTGAKFPNPNAIFFSNKPSKPIESLDAEKCNDFDFNSNKERKNSRDDTNDNNNNNGKIMLIKEPKNKLLVSLPKTENENKKKSENNTMVNYDNFIKQSFLNSLNNCNKTFNKAKDNIRKNKLALKDNRGRGLYKNKSFENIDYYKDKTAS